jgi:ABC-type transporter Mla subunit MlaD
MELGPLDIALIVLVIAGVWAVVEIALTLRKTRKAVDDLSKQATEAMDNLQPSITKLDGVMDELGPASKELEPLLKKAQTTIDAASLDLMQVDEILTDVSTVTGTGANVADAVSNVAGHVATAANGVVSKLSGQEPKQQAKLEGAKEPVDESLPASQVEGDEGYFTYPAGAPAAPATDEKGQAVTATDPSTDDASAQDTH